MDQLITPEVEDIVIAEDLIEEVSGGLAP